MDIPKALVVAPSEQGLPEGEFQLGYDFSRGGGAPPGCYQIPARTETRGWVREAQFQGPFPRPAVTVGTLQGLSERIPDDHLTDVEGRQKCGRNLGVPNVKLQRSLIPIPRRSGGRFESTHPIGGYGIFHFAQ